MMCMVPRRVLVALSAFAWIVTTIETCPAQSQAPAGQPSKVIRLRYVAHAHGLHILDVEADLRLTQAGYSILLHDYTAGLLSFMVHTDVTATATGLFVPGGVRPLHFESTGFSRGARRTAVLDYVGGNPVVRQLAPPEPRRVPVDIRDARGSIDTLSAMADMARTVQQTGRCDGGALIFDGLRLTRVTAATAGEQPVPPSDLSSYGGRALRCDFDSLEIGGFMRHDAQSGHPPSPKRGSAWLKQVLPDQPVLPVRVMFENAKLGIITLYLIKAEEFPSRTGTAKPSQ